MEPDVTLVLPSPNIENLMGVRLHDGRWHVDRNPQHLANLVQIYDYLAHCADTLIHRDFWVWTYFFNQLRFGLEILREDAFYR